MRLIDADAIKYTREDYDGYVDGITPEERERGILVVTKRLIDEMPTVRPGDHGRWLARSHTGIFYCSRCRHEAYDVLLDGRQIGVLLSPYCPECGSRME